MDFGLLGPFAASRGGRPVAIGRRQERLALAALLLAAGHTVSTDRLIVLLWADASTARSRGALQTYVSRLRRRLEPFGVHIEHAGDGYRLDRVSPDRTDSAWSTDVDRFRRLAAAARSTTDPAEQVRLCREALGVWRGEVLADLVDAPGRAEIAADLIGERLALAEQFGRLELDAGHHDVAVEPLLALARVYATAERLVALAMTALHRCGRRAEALRLYADVADALSELDVEVGPDLLLLRERIEAADPGLTRPAGPVYAVRVRDQWLPWNTSGHPALEFCNTYAGWNGARRPGSDWLRSYATLAVWAGHVDVAEDAQVTHLLRAARQAPSAAADVLAEARELRRQLYACLTDPADTAAFKAVAQAAEAAARTSTFVRGPDGLARWRISASAGLRLPLYGVARSAADLLCDPRRLTVTACPGPDCGWLFLDEQGRRRWCSLGTCGHAA